MTDQATPTVHQAVAAIMAEVKAVKKADRNTQQNYSFRGVDSVVNAIHPALVKHGVIVAPVASVLTHTNVTSKSGTAGRACDLKVTYRWFGPAGDYFDTEVCGESMDWGDKSTPKAFSVAYRTCLLQTLNLPTDDPDPDSEQFEHVRPGDHQGASRQRTSTAKKTGGISPGQLTTLQISLKEAGIKDRDEGLLLYETVIGRAVASSKELTAAEATKVIDALKQRIKQDQPESQPGPAETDDAPVAPPFGKDDDG